MISIKRILLLSRRPRLLKGIFQHSSTWAGISVCLFIFFTISIYSRNDSSQSRLNKIHFEEVVHPEKEQKPKQFSTTTEKDKKDVRTSVSQQNFKEEDIYSDDFEEKNIKDDSIFGNVQIAINADQDTFMGKFLSVADKVVSGGIPMDGQSVVKNIANLAQGWQSLSNKLEKVHSKIQNQKLTDVQGFIKPDEVNSLSNTEESPLGPKFIQEPPPNLPIKEEPKSQSSFSSILTKVAPIVLSSLSGDSNSAKSGPSGVLSLLKPLVRTVIESQDGDKKDVNTAVGSLMGVIGGLAPLLRSTNKGKPRSISDTLAILKPVMSAMGPSIMNRILNRDTRKYMDEDPFAGGNSANDSTMDEKTVGQAVGRALSSVVANSIPGSVRLPSPSSIRNPYDMALNLIIGNPKKNTTGEGWKWIRKMAGVDVKNTSRSKWIQEALGQPNRLLHKENIRQFYELVTNFDENCEKVHSIGGVYDWKRDIILETRSVCEDGSLWDSSPKYVLSFGSQLGWSFEEELVQEEDMRVYIVSENIPEEESILTRFWRGKLVPSVEKEVKDAVASPYSEWLQRLKLHKTRLNLVKIDQEDSWEILSSLVQFNEHNFEFIEQLSISVNLVKALKNPSLYSQYVSTIETLKTYGFHIFNVTADYIDSYKDPLYNDTQFYCNYQINFIRI